MGTVVRFPGMAVNPVGGRGRTLPAESEDDGVRTRLVLTLTAAGALAAAAAFAPGAAGAAAAVTQSTALHYTSYVAPPGLADHAGEPSVGLNPKTGNAFLLADTDLSKISFGANSATFAKVTLPPSAGTTSLDPIAFTDQRTGRTFVSQLAGATSALTYTDNDGATFSPVSQGGGFTTFVDHQTVGGGPYSGAPPVTKTSSYPDAVYYCAQKDVSASCARSDDGGVTFHDGLPIYDSFGATQPSSCNGLHGHLKVAPDGTVYVPNFDCDGHAAVTVSTDNGLTWTVHEVLASHTKQDESDPSVAIGSDGTVYLAYEDGDNTADGSRIEVVVSRDKGVTWSAPVDVGAAFGIQNIQFPEAVAGDGDRAAVAFLGAVPAGNDQLKAYPGVFHLYVAHTYDRGASWEVTDTTPNDPVQRGGINLQGTSGGTGNNEAAKRNLLDFNDATIDAQGRVVTVYADGCTGACVTDPAANKYTDQGVVVRQDAGRGVFAAFDPAPLTATTGPAPAPGAASAPPTSGTTSPGTTAVKANGASNAGRLPAVTLAVTPRGASPGSRVVVAGRALLRGKPVVRHAVRLTFRADHTGRRVTVALGRTDAAGRFRFLTRLRGSGAFQAQLAYGVSSAHNREVFVRTPRRFV